MSQAQQPRATSRPNLSVVQEPAAPTPTAGETQQPLEMRYLVKGLVRYNASDLHIKPGRPPLYRINGKLVPAKMDALTSEQAQSVIFGVLTDRQMSELETKREIDVSFKIPDLGRFRCNVFYQRGAVSAAVRMIPLTVPSLENLGMPAILRDLCTRPRGLILVTGPTGSGKSTTLAGMVQYINENNHVHVLSIEDPIEFIYRDAKASITQREVGSDTHSLQSALVAGLRQDPDVIMIGEIRDREMIQAALTAAETGHLVLSTLHTNDARSTIDRILDVFPVNERDQVRIQLASSLVAIVSQQLLVRKDGAGRVCACEVLVKSPHIESLIQKNELDKIPEAMANSSHYYKMQTMNQALEKLVTSKTVSPEEAFKVSPNPDDLKLRLSGVAKND